MSAWWWPACCRSSAPASPRRAASASRGRRAATTTTTRAPGWRARAATARANAAQANSFEALPLFLAGVLVAQQTGARAPVVDALALAFVALRVGYIASYVADRALLRSTLWTLALGCSIALFFCAGW